MDSYEEQVIDDGRYDYSDICTSLPYSKDRVNEIARKIAKNGWDKTTPIVLWDGVILDGRHRYEAAEIADVEPTYTTFVGTLEAAWDHVEVAHDVNDTRPITQDDKKFFLVRRMNALGVQDRGGNGNNQHQSGNRSNDRLAPTLKDHAKAAGVSEITARRENKERKEVFENPDNSDLAEMATTPEGYTEAKKEAKSRADQIREDLSKLTPDEQVDYLGGPQTVVDQKALDNKLEKDFVPYNAALTVLNSLNRLRIYGGKKEIKSNILHALDTSARFQAYEAEALLLLAEVVEEHKEELQAMCLQEVNLNKLN